MPPGLNRLYQLYKWVVVIPFVVIITLILSLICIGVAVVITPDAANAVAVCWSRLACGIIPVRVAIVGRRNYRPGQAYVVVANHLSMVDIPAIHGFMGLNIKWVMKQELRRIPIFGTACHRLGCIFVDRSHRDAAIRSIHTARRRMSDRASVLFFAEGTRSRDGRVLPFKKGAFVFAQETGMPILPITIKNSDIIMPADSLNLTPGRVEIIVHPPLHHLPTDPDQLEATIASVRNAIASPLVP